MTSANVTTWKSGQLMLDTIPHSEFGALQETQLPGIEQMAAAQRWSRKRGWAAAFQGAEVVGEHHAANRSGVAIAGPLHISTSVPTEFESMLGEAVLAPGGVEHPLQYLRSRILARHTHAMLKRGVILVTVYPEPGVRASGLNLWLWEVLAACILCFDGPGIWSRKIWPRPAGSTRSTARSSLPRQQPVQEERERSSITSCSLRRWHIWCKRSKW